MLCLCRPPLFLDFHSWAAFSRSDALQTKACNTFISHPFTVAQLHAGLQQLQGGGLLDSSQSHLQVWQ